MRRTVTYYYAAVDGNGILCIDRTGEQSSFDEQEITEESMVELAEAYPDMIYFTVEGNPSRFRY